MGRKTGFENSREYNEYIRSPEWRERANARLNYDHRKCVVCGKEAREVHHMTYNNFGHENMEDIVSLCHECHEEAEKISDVTLYPCAIQSYKGKSNFMAAMRTDAKELSPVIFDYLISANGADIYSLLRFRKPPDNDLKHSWYVLRNAVEALCRKRYEIFLRADRTEIAVSADINHITSVCLAVIEHTLRNDFQGSLRDSVLGMHEAGETYKQIAEEIKLSEKTVYKISRDAGDSFGPSTREEVMYYCGLDAAAGIRPQEGFPCLTKEDYEILNNFADYEAAVSGNGQFMGEYWS